MQSPSSSSGPGRPSSPEDEYNYPVWFCLSGALAGLGLASACGSWLINSIAGAIVGYVIGALVERFKR